jgi:hypothetical protein
VVLKLWSELFMPCRRTWAGLAAAWVAILLFNLTHADRHHQGAAISTAQGQEMRLVFQEQQRILVELVGPAQPEPPVAPPRREEQHPRSEIQSLMLSA